MNDSAAGTENPYLPLREAAARLGLSLGTLYHWTSAGKLHEGNGLRRVGGRRLVDWEVLRAAIDRGELA
jgi:predicted site-specific integrase-resolvase